MISDLARGTCHSLKGAGVGQRGAIRKDSEKKRAELRSPPTCFDSSVLSWRKRCFKGPLGGQMTDEWETARLTRTNGIFFFSLFLKQKPLTKSAQGFKRAGVYVLPVQVLFIYIFYYSYILCEFQFDRCLESISYIRGENQHQPPGWKHKWRTEPIWKRVFHNWCHRSAILRQMAFIATPACFSFLAALQRARGDETALVASLQQQTVMQQMVVCFFRGDRHEARCFHSQGFKSIKNKPLLG